MKLRLKIELTMFLLFSIFIVNAQNNFPSSGNVGIGTTNPQGPLHVFGGNTYLWGLNLGYGTNPAIITTDDNSKGISFQIAGTEYARLHNNGNFGIGTTTPINPLSISGNGEFLFALGDVSNNNYGAKRVDIGMTGLYGQLSAHIVGVGGMPLVLQNYGGNVGIGKSDPSYKLDVNGDARFSNSIICNSSASNFNALQLIANTGYPSSINFYRGGYANWYLGSPNNSTALAIGQDQTFNSYAMMFDQNSNAQFSGNIIAQGYSATNGNSYIASDKELYFDYGVSNSYGIFKSGSVLNFATGGSYNFWNGNVGIGVPSPTEKLSVNGNIRSKKLIVTQNGWSDYVFNDGYHLRPLSQVENFIKENKHLPEVPTAKEVEKNGIDVGETQALLLKKIEELTLYMIEQSKKTEGLMKENTEIKIGMKKLQEENKELKKIIESK